MTIKKIYQEGKLYLLRFSFPIKTGTIKVHIIFQDDKEEPHTHPWNFISFLIIPYKELIVRKIEFMGDVEMQFYSKYKHYPFKILERDKNQLHKVSLYRILGIKIPAITIGKYGHKTQLCSFCKELGYCKTERQ